MANHKLKQLHLADMEHGLAKLLAVVDLSPPRITDLTGVTFETAYEAGLGYVLAVLLTTEDGKQFSMRQYYQVKSLYPNRTEIIGSEFSKNSGSDLTYFLQLLNFNSNVVLWRCDQ